MKRIIAFPILVDFGNSIQLILSKRESVSAEGLVSMEAAKTNALSIDRKKERKLTLDQWAQAMNYPRMAMAMVMAMAK